MDGHYIQLDDRIVESLDKLILLIKTLKSHDLKDPLSSYP